MSALLIQLITFLFFILLHKTGGEYFYCDFEKDFCSLTQEPKNSQLTWNLANQASLRLGGNPNGSHAYLHLSNAASNVTRPPVLLSMPQSGSQCLTFRFYASDANFDVLHVYMRTGNQTTGTVIFTHRTDTFFADDFPQLQSKAWLNAQAVLNAIDSYQFEIAVSRKNSSKTLTIGIDDVQLSKTCPKKACPTTSDFRCDNNICIPGKWRCDGHPDCEDRSDEHNCPKTCSKAEFACGFDGKPPFCIPEKYRCDHEQDCANGKDEMDCVKKVCPEKTMIVCKTSRKCIHMDAQCDGIDDCDDLSDEQNCPHTKPPVERPLCNAETSFRCKNGECIGKDWWCDGFKDCSDGSDELDTCPSRNCKKEEFHCLNGNSCIPKSFVCDGYNDCNKTNEDKYSQDETSELCASRVQCKSDAFHCPGSLKCIPMRSVCDGLFRDCSDGADEGLFCNKDAKCANKCQQNKCQRTPTSDGVCYCNDGYELQPDNFTCLRRDPCLDYPCSQLCINNPDVTIGYECACYHNYILQNYTQCRYNETSDPEILFVDVKMINKFNLNTNIQTSLITDMVRGVALDYDIRTGRLFYTDVTQNVIKSSFLHGNSKSLEQSDMVISTGLAVPDGLAVDWVTQNIYFAESSANRIDVASFDGQKRSSLIAQGLKSPRGLALDPKKGYIFITDWGGQAKLLRAQMDGSNLQVLVVESVGWPNGITIDYEEEIIYWVDARHDYIDSVNYNGTDRRHVIKGKQFVPHPFAITIFKEYIYFTDWIKRGIVRVHKKLGEKDYKVILSDLKRPMDLQLMSYGRQQMYTNNPCNHEKRLKCQHLCVIKSIGEYLCLCNYGYMLAANRHTCRPVEKFLLFARSWEVRAISLDDSYVHDVMTPILGLSSAVGVDYDARNKYVYFSDLKVDKIFRAYIGNNTGGQKEPIVSGLANTDGIAVDWVGRNLYWTDTKAMAEISVARLDGSFKRTLIKGSVNRPRAIVVDPARGYLFYTDWYSPAKLGRANMDGTDHLIFNLTALHWPNGLAIDYKEERIYWADAKFDKIESVDLNGNNRRVVKEDIKHSFGLALDDQYFYWTDWLLKQVLRANRTNTTEVTAMRGNYGGLMGIKVYDKRDHKTSNICLDAACEQLCLLRPNNSFVCVCANNHTLRRDNISCAVGKGSRNDDNCREGFFYCDSICIKDSWKCDGTKDCPLTGADEAASLCHNRTCADSEFMCKSTRQCIPKTWRCDRNVDCRDDRSDEDGCRYPNECHFLTQFRCATSGRCISREEQCDGVKDCADGSDESACRVLIKDERKIERGELITVLPTYLREFSLLFEVYLESFEQGEFHNILHLSIGANENNYGDRLPGIWINPDHLSVHIGSAVNNNKNYIVNTQTLQLKKWHVFRISYTRLESEYYFIVELNNETIHKKLNSNPQSFKNVKVYTSDPWYPPQDGKIRNLVILNGAPERKLCDSFTSFQCETDGTHPMMRGPCIPKEWMADGVFDCLDGSDERGVVRKCNNTELFKRCTNGRCVLRSSFCDRANDCGDWSDERNCSNSKPACNATTSDCQCKLGEFLCTADHCISRRYVCDGHIDCPTVLDEINCPAANCTTAEFRCKNGNCVEKRFRCDSVDDCGDNSDEFVCTSEPRNCTEQEWKCNNTLSATSCIPMHQVCDGNVTCLDKSDEGLGCQISWCGKNNGGCAHICYETPKESRCGCHLGYELAADGFTCDNVDECTRDNGGCSQLCYDTKGSSKCKCAEGYRLRFNQQSCVAGGPVAQIVFSDYKSIRQMDAKTGNTISIVTNLKSAIGVDFDWSDQRIYWSDVNQDKIERVYLNGTGRETVVGQGMNSPEGIAIDWISKKIYWTDMRLDTIEVAELDGSMRCVLISKNIDSPRALAVDPREGLLFWTDWGQKPDIERAEMDGSNRKVLRDTNIAWPNGLTLDLPTKKLYYVDARLDLLVMMNYDGTEQKLVMHGSILKHAFGLSVFEDNFFFTDWTSGSIRRANKITGKRKLIYKAPLLKPMGLQIVHPARQPHSSESIVNYCDGNKCTHLCVLKAKGFACMCPYGMMLNKDGRSCEVIKEMLLYARRTEIRGISLNPNDTTDKIIPITKVHNAIGIDFHLKKQFIYWSDVQTDSISRIHFNGTDRENVIPSGLPAPDGIAIDWIADNLYWTDADTDKIEVARLDGRYRKIVVSRGLAQPRAISVHPMKGKLVWTDWGNRIIEIASLDGSNRKTLVSTGIGYPNGMTIDRTSDKVYWCDAQKDRIEWIFLNGTGRQQVEMRGSHSQVVHPFGIEVFENYIYWTDWGKRAILRYDMHTKHVTQMRGKLLSLMGLKVLHEKQQQGTNMCAAEKNLCSHLCFSMSATEYRCGCATGFELDQDNRTCHGSQSFLLYSTTTQIRGIPLDKDSDSESIVPILGLMSTYAMDFLYKTSDIYLVDNSLDALFKVKQDGSHREKIISTGLDRCQGVAVDWIAENIYWSDAGTNLIEVARLDGTHRLVLINEGLQSPRAIVLYPSKGYIYWTDWGDIHPKIERATLDGENRRVLVNSTIIARKQLKISWPNGLTIDYGTDTIYWVDAQHDMVMTMDLNGGNLRKLLSKDNVLIKHPYAITVSEDSIFWTDWTEKAIFRLPKNDTSSTPVLVRGKLTNVRDVHVYDKSRQTGSNKCAKDNGGCEHLCFATSSTKRRCMCTAGKLAADGMHCTSSEEFIIFAKRNEIQFLDMNPLRRTSSPYPAITSLQNAIGVDFDFATGTIYYSDIFKKEIGSIQLNGTGKTVLVQGLKTPDGIAFDWTSGMLYWTDAQENTINRLNKQKKKEVLIHDGLDEPRAIALNPCEKMMYWTDWGTKPYIKRATVNGFDPVTIIETNLGWPNGITVDIAEGRIYWGDARTDRIESAKFDGSDRKIVVQGTPHPFGVSLYGDYIYWSDWVTRSVNRASKRTGGGVINLKKLLSAQPMDIKVYSQNRQNCSFVRKCFNETHCTHGCRVAEGGHEVCVCPADMQLVNGYRCIAQNVTATHCENSFICADSKECIEEEFVCDGDKDCGDNSDESKVVCAHHVCSDTSFRCKSTGQCISAFFKCDHQTDCEDGSDELDCNFCKKDDFKCDNGKCVKVRFRCDGENDCGDDTDEIGCPGPKCEPGFFKCTASKGCLRESWLCDGYKDCGDGSDEVLANCNKTCRTDEFKCADQRKCVPMSWKCDAMNDCFDGSDEGAHCAQHKCGSDKHTCGDHSCVSTSFLCDGEQDCADGSDELDCKRECKTGQFKCNKTHRCIPWSHYCDGDDDCGDGSDESVENGCRLKSCKPGTFKCNNNICIRASWRCDGDNDCGDSSDEQNCPCDAATKFNCTSSGECLSKDVVCDGVADCKDGSDERTAACPCGVGQFQCKKGAKCIDHTLVCNRKRDCKDNSDERSCFINECDNPTINKCSQICIDQPQGYECRCKSGYRLEADKTMCTSNCDDYKIHGCSHFCTLLNNSRYGDHKCSCAQGYSLSKDKSSCKHNTNTKPFMLISSKSFIKTLSISSGPVDYSILQDLSSRQDFVSVDYNWKTQKFYWIASQPGAVRQAAFNSTAAPKSLFQESLPNPIDVAIEWIGNNLYSTDWITQSISVRELSGRFGKKKLYQDSVNVPFSLAVHPKSGFLYYTTKSVGVATQNSQICRIGLDGNKRQVLFDGIQLARGIAIDHVTDTVYWSEAGRKRIVYAHIKSLHKRHVLSHVAGEVFGLSLFENHIYYTARHMHQSSLNRIHRWTGKNAAVLKESKDKFYTIKVVHPLRQPESTNPCENAKCSTLCLLSPGDPPGYRCACPDNFRLLNDGRTCASNCSLDQFTCANYRCVKAEWRCDSENDCGDGSDELHCDVLRCKKDYFLCGNGNCSESFYRCDGENDCGDNSDEQNCEEHKCYSFQFRCANDRCVLKTRLCDGQDDCMDGSDEIHCTNVTRNCDKETNFQCANGQCIAKQWTCDGGFDCIDHSDETPALCHTKKCASGFFKCNNSRCILESYKCDFDNDCKDNSDEELAECKEDRCNATMHFKCKTSGKCIMRSWHCDFDKDCLDGSDEQNCTAIPCPEDKFLCDNKNCIQSGFHCDNEDDCGDNSDERDCPPKHTCLDTQFACLDKQQCIDKTWRCDAHPDCVDKSDEIGCPRDVFPPCPSSHYQCSDGSCIRKDWVCDNQTDCFDGSDEGHEMCSSLLTFCNPETHLQCETSGLCVRFYRKCDGVRDCADGTDERNCLRTCPELTDIKCGDGSCVDENKRCDFFADCTNGADERGCVNKGDKNVTCSPSINCNNGACVQQGPWVQCQCSPGHAFSPARQCVNVDECLETPLKCDQTCVDAKGTFLCKCANGYVYDQGQKHCKIKGPRGVLLVPSDNSLMLVTRDGAPEKRAWDRVNVVAYNTRVNGGNFPTVMYVSDGETSVHIYTVIESFLRVASPLVEKHRRKRTSEPLYNELSRIGDIAPSHLEVDYLGNNIFWTDSRRRYAGIFMSSWRGDYKRTVLKLNTRAVAFALNPEHGMMYWAEESFIPEIRQARLDGTSVRSLVIERLEHPTSLAVDVTSQRLFWCDMKKHTVESIRFDGTFRMTVIDRTDLPHLQWPYSIEVFEGKVYGLMRYSGKMFSVDKKGRGKVYLMPKHFPKSSQLKVYHQNKQLRSSKDFVNPCDRANCGQMCLVINGSATCVCHENVFKCEAVECDRSFCSNRGNCSVDNEGVYQCKCEDHWVGRRCEGFTTNRCPVPCDHGNCALDQIGRPKCKCHIGYTGDQCSTRQCDLVKCGHDTTCRIVNQRPSCCHGESCESTCSKPCDNNHQCVINLLGNEICKCILKNGCDTDRGKSTSNIYTAVIPVVVGLLVLLIFIVVICLKRRRERNQYGLKKMKNIEMENPTFTYQGLQEQQLHEDEDFMNQYSGQYGNDSYFEEPYGGGESLEKIQFNDPYSEKAKLVEDDDD